MVPFALSSSIIRVRGKSPQGPGSGISGARQEGQESVRRTRNYDSDDGGRGHGRGFTHVSGYSHRHNSQATKPATASTTPSITRPSRRFFLCLVSLLNVSSRGRHPFPAQEGQPCDHNRKENPTPKHYSLQLRASTGRSPDRDTAAPGTGVGHAGRPRPGPRASRPRPGWQSSSGVRPSGRCLSNSA